MGSEMCIRDRLMASSWLSGLHDWLLCWDSLSFTSSAVLATMGWMDRLLIIRGGVDRDLGLARLRHNYFLHLQQTSIDQYCICTGGYKVKLVTISFLRWVSLYFFRPIAGRYAGYEYDCVLTFLGIIGKTIPLDLQAP